MLFSWEWTFYSGELEKLIIPHRYHKSRMFLYMYFPGIYLGCAMLLLSGKFNMLSCLPMYRNTKIHKYHVGYWFKMTGPWGCRGEELPKSGSVSRLCYRSQHWRRGSAGTALWQQRRVKHRNSNNEHWISYCSNLRAYYIAVYHLNGYIKEKFMDWWSRVYIDSVYIDDANWIFVPLSVTGRTVSRLRIVKSRCGDDYAVLAGGWSECNCGSAQRLSRPLTEMARKHHEQQRSRPEIAVSDGI